MATNKEETNFDAAAWKGPSDLATATVRLSMLLGLGALWLGVGAWIYFSL